MSRRAYPRSPMERSGQYNRRAEPPSSGFYPGLNICFNVPHSSKDSPCRTLEDRDKTPRHLREGIEPKCVVVATKKKGFAPMPARDSDPMTFKSAAMMLNHFPVDQYYRYRVNVYLK